MDFEIRRAIEIEAMESRNDFDGVKQRKAALPTCHCEHRPCAIEFSSWAKSRKSPHHRTHREDACVCKPPQLKRRRLPRGATFPAPARRRAQSGHQHAGEAAAEVRGRDGHGKTGGDGAAEMSTKRFTKCFSGENYCHVSTKLSYQT